MTKTDLRMEHIIRAASEIEGVTVADLLGPRRLRRLAYARRRCLYLIRRFTDISYPRIGAKFDRDHTMVLYAFNECERRLVMNEPVERLLTYCVIRRARQLAQCNDWQRQEVTWLTRPRRRSLVRSSVRLPKDWAAARVEMVEDMRDRINEGVSA